MTRLWKPELNKYFKKFALLFSFKIKASRHFLIRSLRGFLVGSSLSFNVWSCLCEQTSPLAYRTIKQKDTVFSYWMVLLLPILAPSQNKKKPDMIMLELDFTTTTRKKPQPPNKMGLYHKWEKKHFPLGSFNKVLCGVKHRLQVIFTGLGTP